MRSEQLQPYLQPFRNEKTVIVHDQNVSDIITGILANHDRYKREYDKIAQHFAGRNAYETGRNIWQFLKDNVTYKVEPDSRQMLKSPAAIIAPGTTSDCKNYSLFTGGILDALNRKGARIPWVYRFSSYRIFDKVPQHVFVVMYPNTNREVWIDAVLPYYDEHKQYYYKVDKKVNNMSLIALAGFDDIAGVGKRGDKRRAFFAKLKKDIQKAGKFVTKFGASPARNAFLELTKLNFRSLATNLKKKNDKDPAAVRKFWENLGGNYASLVKNIEKGATHKRLGAVEDVAAMGVEPVTTAALIAAGSAIAIAAIQKLGLGKGEAGGDTSGADAATFEKGKADYDTSVKNDIFKEADGQETANGDKILKGEGGLTKYLLIGGAALAAFMLFRKK